MTSEGRKAWHENCIKQGKPSPYANEFAEPIKVAEKPSKPVKGGKK